jgi:hypothetical protein
LSSDKDYHKSLDLKFSIAEFVYTKVYKSDKDRIPLPIFVFIMSQFGPWAGASIYLAQRQHTYNLKKEKIKNTILNFVLPGLVLIFATICAFKDIKEFGFGFFQNLLSDLVLLILIYYILPKRLNTPKNYNLELIKEEEFSDIQKVTIVISIKNIGEEAYKINELLWEIYFPDFSQNSSIDFNEYLIETINGDIEDFSDSWISGKKLYGFNQTPLFVSKRLDLAKIVIDQSVFDQINQNTIKIYYSILTSYGNFPSKESVTKDFFMIGLAEENYPQIGEFVINEGEEKTNHE